MHYSIDVLHLREFTGLSPKLPINLEEETRKVASIEADSPDIENALEFAFHKTQNIHDSWNGENSERSTSVGDLMLVNDKIYGVAFFGFTLLSPQSVEQ